MESTCTCAFTLPHVYMPVLLRQPKKMTLVTWLLVKLPPLRGGGLPDRLACPTGFLFVAACKVLRMSVCVLFLLWSHSLVKVKLWLLRLFYFCIRNSCQLLPSDFSCQMYVKVYNRQAQPQQNWPPLNHTTTNTPSSNMITQYFAMTQPSIHSICFIPEPSYTATYYLRCDLVQAGFPT